MLRFIINHLVHNIVCMLFFFLVYILYIHYTTCHIAMSVNVLRFYQIGNQLLYKRFNQYINLHVNLCTSVLFIMKIVCVNCEYFKMFVKYHLTIFNSREIFYNITNFFNIPRWILFISYLYWFFKYAIN